MFSRLRRDYCRVLVAQSENARLHMYERHQDRPRAQEVLSKIRVIHQSVPDDKVAWEKHVSRDRGKTFKLLFVGREFFRKGGHLAVMIFEKLRKRYPVELTVVSSMNENNYVNMPVEGTANSWISRMEFNGVRHFKSVARNEVRMLLSESDILLLPTLDDSGGYVVLEAMATGVVSVVPRIRALPEFISHREDGILVSVPVTNELRLDVARANNHEIVNDYVREVEQLLTDTSKIRAMECRARESYLNRFAPEIISNKLAQVYRDALR